MKLSVAMAVHNEERNILRCLESVYDWVDEIVVVDGESTDNTIKIVKDFDKDRKIHIFNEPNLPMFHVNKQKAIEKCKGEWILQLDADEIVSPELRREVQAIVSRSWSRVSQELVKTNSTNSDKLSEATFSSHERSEAGPIQQIAYWIPRLNYFLGRPLRKGGQYPDYTIRLYKNGVAHFPCKSVHEQVEISRSWSRVEIGYLKSDLLHFPYPTLEDYLEKWIRYSILEAEMWKKQGIKPSFGNTIKYMIILPKWWFLKTYIRHKGFADGFPGFVFSLFSACRFWITYVKLYELYK